MSTMFVERQHCQSLIGAFIIFSGVTGVTGVTNGDNILNPSNSKVFSDHTHITPEISVRCNRCDVVPKEADKVLHLVTPLNDNGVTLQPNETQALHPLHLVTPNYYTPTATHQSLHTFI
jgi:hypothetical protein